MQNIEGKSLFLALLGIAIGAVLYPIGERVVSHLLDARLDVSVSDPVSIPLPLDQSIACLNSLQTSLQNWRDSPSIDSLAQDSIDVSFPKDDAFDCLNVIQSPSFDAQVYNLRVSNGTRKLATDVTLFANAAFALFWSPGETVALVRTDELRQGLNVGSIPPGGDVTLLISDSFRLFSDTYIQSNLGEEIIRGRVSSWTRFIFYISLGLFIFLIVIVLAGRSTTSNPQASVSREDAPSTPENEKDGK